MSAKNVTLGVMVAILVVIVSFMMKQTGAERSARSKLATLASQQAVLDAEIERLKQSTAQPVEAAARQNENPAAPMSAPGVFPNTVVAPSPEQGHINTLRAWLQLRNRPLYARLKLTAEQILKFEEVETTHWLRSQDIVETARASSLPANDPAIATLRKEEQSRFEKEQADVLGEPAFKAVQEYQRTLPARALANALAGNTFYADPLTAQQGEQLTQILASNSASYRKGGPVRPAEIDVNLTLAQIQTVLSPEQFAAFKKPWLAMQAGQKLTPLLAAAVKAAPPNTPAPSVAPKK